MNLARFALDNRVLVLAVTAVLLFYGAVAFLQMPRREDPEITIRAAVVVTQWPGATAAKVEELVTDPLEQAIGQIDAVDKLTSKSRTGLSIVTVELDETLVDIDQYWDEVRTKVTEAQASLPDGCGAPRVDTDFGDVAAVIYALVQTPAPGRDAIEWRYGWRELELLAEKVRDDFKTVDSVAKVDIEGIQDEVIFVDVDAEWAKLDLTIDELRSILAARNITAAGGEIDHHGARFTVQPTGEFQSPEQIRGVLVDRLDGAVPVRLADLPLSGVADGATLPSARVRRDYVDPPRSQFRYTSPDLRSDRCLLLAVTMKSARNLVEMGRQLEARVAWLESRILPPDVRLVRVNDLPRQVDSLIGEFVTNLWQAILIVLAVAFLMMGWRPAVIMAAAVPLCMIASILVVGLMGIELEQFSIASLIIALGMLVDNAIVVSDNVLRELGQRQRDDDDPRAARVAATVRGAWSLALPVLTSTATTVAAFLPMLTIVGAVGEYTRSLPIVVATTLIVSYLVAMTVTPLLCLWLLQPTAPGAPAPVTLWRRVGRLLVAVLPRRRRPASTTAAAAAAGPAPPAGYERLLRWCLGHRLVVLGAAAAAVVASLSLVPAIGNQFFPGGVRDQFFVHVWLPEGATLAATRAKCRQVEDILLATSAAEVDGRPVERLRSAVTFVGTGGPRLNLTTNPQQTFPNYGFVLVNTTDRALSRGWAEQVKAGTDRIAGARIDVVPFMLGPYIENPVEFRLYGTDAAVLREQAAAMVQVFRDTPGTVNPFSDWYNAGYSLAVDIDEEAANLAGVSNSAVADTMATLISGGRLTTYREGDHQVPVVLRMRPERRAALLEDPGIIYVDGHAGKVPLEAIARVHATWQPAVIARRDNVRCVTVGSKVAPGYLANDIAAQVRPRLQERMRSLPPDYRLEEGGEREQTTASQEKLMTAFTMSFLLILLVLIAQYGSLLKPLVILSTVPLALVGALLGLFWSGWALGFMPSLGIIALAGVVINNAIILVDFIETNVGEGAALDDAIAQAGSQRMQPILLTTLTTVGGLLPLALFGGPMWAGMAWAMIVGLLLSTALTLLVVPTIYATCVAVFGMRVRR
ncbi:MAG: efflux RND transporter permease subunit [Planctomycetota bacterium]